MTHFISLFVLILFKFTFSTNTYTEFDELGAEKQIPAFRQRRWMEKLEQGQRSWALYGPG